MDVLKKITNKLREKGWTEEDIDNARYELSGHGIPEAINHPSHFSYRILKKKIVVKYDYIHPSNFCENEDGVRMVIECEAKD